MAKLFQRLQDYQFEKVREQPDKALTEDTRPLSEEDITRYTTGGCPRLVNPRRAHAQRGLQYLVCLSVCLSVRLLPRFLRILDYIVNPLEICCFTCITYLTSISHSSFTQYSFTVAHTASLGTMLRSCYYLQTLSTQLSMHIFAEGFALLCFSFERYACL